MGGSADSKWTVADIPDQAGRTVVVTGANSGLGLITAEQLAARGAQVVMAVRDLDKGRRAAEGITARHRDATVQVRPLDLADLDSVRAFAETIEGDGLDVNVLVNNAGVMFTPHRHSRQGHELQFAVNHLGHFALTGLLLKAIRSRDDPRVVTVTSTAHRYGRLPLDDLDSADGYSPFRAYAQSKLANVLFGLELHRRLSAAGEPVRSLLAHPGYAATNLQTSGPTGVVKLLGRLGNLLMAQDALTGTLPQLYAATDPQAGSGQFIGPDGLREMRGHPRVVRPVAAGQELAAARQLWERSEHLTGVHFDLPAVG